MDDYIKGSINEVANKPTVISLVKTCPACCIEAKAKGYELEQCKEGK